MSETKKNKAIIFSAPSGAGKTTIVHHLLGVFDELAFSISACSRPRRHNERKGKDYHFLSIESFKAKIANDEFVEWEEVYKDNFYGTLKAEVERIWSEGKTEWSSYFCETSFYSTLRRPFKNKRNRNRGVNWKKIGKSRKRASNCRPIRLYFIK